MKRIAIFVLISALGVGVVASAQESSPDLNSYYYYPVSAGFSYRQLTPLADFASGFVVHEFLATGRVPLPGRPSLYGLLTGGLIQFDSQDELLPEKWDHQHIVVAPGFGVAHRFSREFEVGADAAVGLTQSIFPNAIEQPVGALNLFASAQAKISLDPSFNVSIDVTPGLRYLRSFSPFREYDGISFGLGIAAHYRFGRDPDSAESLIRALRFGEVSMPDVFAAMQSYYVGNPVGRVTITNTERYQVSDIRVSFYQAGFMDSPTPSATIETLEPGESRTVDLLASFNDEIFARQGITPLTGEVRTSYTARGRAADQSQAVTYDLHDKTALTWDDNKKVGAFVTPADGALRNYASFVRRAADAETVDGLSDQVQIAMQLYHGLAELGIIYQEDPTSPFTQVQENAVLVDSVSLPRDTLTRATGDCDDLTVLYISLLESLGVETGFMTVPGHIYAVFNSGVESRDYARLNPDRDMILDVDGYAWVPVEITLIGRENFMGAWRTGIRLWNQAKDAPASRAFNRTSVAQGIYRPVGLRERDLGLQYGDENTVVEAFVSDRNRLSRSILDSYEDAARAADSAGSWNEFGIVAAQLGQYDDAVQAFRQASLRSSRSVSPRINLGSVSYLREDYTGALGAFQEAEGILAARGRSQDSSVLAKVLINISKTHYAMENFPEAENYFARAAEEEPGVIQEYSYLANVGSDGGARASDAGAADEIIFVEETD